MKLPMAAYIPSSAPAGVMVTSLQVTPVQLVILAHLIIWSNPPPGGNNTFRSYIILEELELVELLVFKNVELELLIHVELEEELLELLEVNLIVDDDELELELLISVELLD